MGAHLPALGRMAISQGCAVPWPRRLEHRPRPRTGIIGRPSTATAARGKAALDSLTATFVGHLKALTG